ncbi:uncharacterized protein LOC141643908 [Silene latifolia]|uniref:uncharacterized protein LOC141643908 n=1 Tax=Silene latifolia TaxID=37657 RepID=UPI003D77CBCA
MPTDTPESNTIVNNPLQVTNNDANATKIVTNLFDGTGFNGWKRGMEIALSAKNKLGFVDGSIAKPALSTANYNFTAQVAWEELENRFGQTNGARLYGIQKKLVDYSQGNDSISTYFTKMKLIWDEIDAMGLNLACSCTCSCGAAAKREKFQQDQRVGNNLTSESLPSLAAVYNSLLQEERQREIQHELQTQVDSATFYAKNFQNKGPHTSYNKQSQQSPNLYGKQPQQQFYNKPHSTPVNNQQQPKGDDELLVKFCKYCKNPGHTIRYCKKLEFNTRKKFANAAQTDGASGYYGTNNGSGQQGFSPQQVAGSSSGSGSTFGDVTHVMMQQLKTMMHNTQATAHPSPPPDFNPAANFAGNSSYSTLSSCHETWIVDSGASDHMCANINLFSFIKAMSHPFSISLPTGQTTFINSMGTVPINSDLILHDVLYVPTFQFNLLSILKLSQQLNTAISFSPTSCFVQGSSMKMPLALGNMHKGLYLLHRNPAQSTVPKSSILNNAMSHAAICNSADVWHSRLGHLPLYKLQKYEFCKFSEHNKSQILSCITCAKARQHRFSFPDSHIQTHNAFQLIHVDLWGPYPIQTYNGHKYFLTIVDDYTRTTWVYLLSCKSSAFDYIKNFIAFVKTQFNKTVQILRSDNALELGSSNLTKDFLTSHGLIYQTSCFHTPQKMGWLRGNTNTYLKLPEP